LNTAAITFDDFPSEYAEKLMAVQLQHNNTPAYIWPLVDTPLAEDQLTIPPIVHFIWFQNLYHDHLDVSMIPVAGSHAPGRCREYNPDFQLIMWNATMARQLIEDHYIWFLPTYDSYRYPIQHVDALKYFVLYHFGGVYMDMDIACRRRLNPLLPFPAWFPKASPFGVNNDLMASRARHPFFKFMLKQLITRNKNLLFPYLTIFWGTSPRFTTDMMKRWIFRGPSHDLGKHKSDLGADAVFVLPEEFYAEKYTSFGHSPGGTWYGKDVAVVLWLIDRPWLFALVPAIPLLAYWIVLKVRLARRKRNVICSLKTRRV